MLGLFTSITFAAILIVAWRTDPKITRTILACWGIVMTIVLVLQQAGNVEFGPMGAQFNAIDYGVAMILGAVIGLIARWANGLLPKIDTEKLASQVAGQDASGGGPNVFNAAAPSVAGMSTQAPPPARGGLL